MRKYMHGITLLELMVVVVIIGILTAIAFPNYRAYVTRAQRGEAKAALLEAAVNQEKWYLTNQVFTLDLADLGFSSPFQTDSGNYTLGVGSTAGVANDFTVTATRVPSDTESAKCGTLSIDSTGNKSSGPQTDCWTRRN